MVRITPEHIAIVVLSVFAFAGFVSWLFRKDIDLIKAKEDALSIMNTANQEGLPLLADMCKGFVVGDLAEVVKDLRTVAAMAKNPATLVAALNTIFTKQLALHMADPVLRQQVIAAVNAYNTQVAASNAAVIAAAGHATATVAATVAPAAAAAPATSATHTVTTTTTPVAVTTSTPVAASTTTTAAPVTATPVG